MNIACGYKICSVFLIPFFQVLIVLEIVGIQFAVLQCRIRFYIIAELNDVHCITHLFQIRLDVVQNFSMRSDGCSDRQRLVIAVAAAAPGKDCA